MLNVYLFRDEDINIGYITTEDVGKEYVKTFNEKGVNVHLLSTFNQLLEDNYFGKYLFTTDKEYFIKTIEESKTVYDFSKGFKRIIKS